MRDFLRHRAPDRHGGEREGGAAGAASAAPAHGASEPSPEEQAAATAAPSAAQDSPDHPDRPAGARDVPGDLWQRCPRCRAMLYHKEVARNLKVCHKCGHHLMLSARERIALLADPDTFLELDAGMLAADPIGFVRPSGQSYESRLEDEATKAHLPEAAVYGLAEIEGLPVVLAALDYSFLVATMGSVVGEKITRAFERALAEERALTIVSASGGARQDEGILALMQMAKTTAALARLAAARLPYVSVLTDPTLAGVTASFASQGDCVIAEPGAVIGFAGPRLIEQILREKLPPDADTAEFQLNHGMIDLLVPRPELKATIARLLRLYMDARCASGRSTAIDGQLVGALQSAVTPLTP